MDYQKFTPDYIGQRLEQLGLEIPLARRCREAAVGLFRQGLLDGAEGADSFCCQDLNCLPGKFYSVGKEIGIECSPQDSTEPKPALIRLAERSELLRIADGLDKLFEQG